MSRPPVDQTPCDVESDGVAASASRRGLLHGVIAAGAVTAAMAGTVELRATASAAPMAVSHARRKGRHRKRHRKHHPSPSATPSPVTQPSAATTPAPSIPVSSPSATSSASTVPTSPAPASNSSVALIDDPIGRNLVSRFSYGLTPALSEAVQQAGGPTAWFQSQLRPGDIADDVATAQAGWWPSLTRSPLELYQRDRAGLEYGWQVGQSYQAWLVVQRMATNRTVLEIMTEFWENHLNVPVQGDGCFTWRAGYGRIIRANALGRFEDLLTSAVTHPAMLTYLNGATSTKAHPNENLGRELLELHTVGVGQYTEKDVEDSARILTGWRVDIWNTWAAYYSTQDHYTGPVSVMGFADDNLDPDGQDLTGRYLRYLARHPGTARRLAQKIAVRFCRDDPSDALVDQLAQVYLASGTDVSAVLTALVASPEFQSSAGMKVRTPADDVVATARALGMTIEAPDGPVQSWHASMALLYQCMSIGQDPLNWPRPDGAPIDSASWLSPARMIGSINLHWLLANGYYPTTGATYRASSSWLPPMPVRLDDLVDHVAQQVLLTRATPELVAAVCAATKTQPSDVITSQDGLVQWWFGRLLATLLDSPTHLTR